jgi:hypothetical protein
MSDLVKARWLPGYPVDLQGQGTIAPGDIVEISAGEAKDSDNWEIVRTARDPKPTSEEST